MDIESERRVGPFRVAYIVVEHDGGGFLEVVTERLTSSVFVKLFLDLELVAVPPDHRKLMFPIVRSPRLFVQEDVLGLVDPLHPVGRVGHAVPIGVRITRTPSVRTPNFNHTARGRRKTQYGIVRLPLHRLRIMNERSREGSFDF
jgi:hypothetical protein